MGESGSASVHDNGDGSYRVRIQTGNTIGTVFLFIQRNRQNVPGSPFEVRQLMTLGDGGVTSVGISLVRDTMKPQ